MVVIGLWNMEFVVVEYVGGVVDFVIYWVLFVWEDVMEVLDVW